MLPRRFDLHRPSSLPAVFELMARHGEDASLYAGGTELLVALKARVLQYGHLIDLKGVAGLREIRLEDGALVIGALATHHRIATDRLVAEFAPAYARLSGDIANIRVRCAGTIGGNLCFAEPHADPPALLAALGARVRLQAGEQERECAVDDFFQGAFATAREPDEVLTAVVVPRPGARSGAAYRSFGHLERPAVGAAAVVAADGGGCAAIRLRLGAIGSTPIRLPATEAALAGAPLDALADTLRRCAADEIGGVEAMDDVHGSADYKRHLALVLLGRAAAAAAEAAGGRGRPA
jgi:carbon-monoxide dehydrogenase medium subunit